jgi:hypothetical protein
VANEYESIKHVVHLANDLIRPCEECGKLERSEFLADRINHYIAEHGYVLLHIGTETTRDQDGKPWFITVALLGKRE